MKQLLLFSAICLFSGFSAFGQQHKEVLSGYRTSDNVKEVYYGYKSGQTVCIKSVNHRDNTTFVDSLYYDPAGRLVRYDGLQKEGAGLKKTFYIEYTYNGKGQMESRTNYNLSANPGSSDWVKGGTYRYGYDDAGRMNGKVLYLGEDTKPHMKAKFAYDVNGRLSVYTEFSNSFDDEDTYEKSLMIKYFYDEEGRLVKDELYILNGSKLLVINTIRVFEYDKDGDCVTYIRKNDVQEIIEKRINIYDKGISSDELLLPDLIEADQTNTTGINHKRLKTEQWNKKKTSDELVHMFDYDYLYEKTTGVLSPVLTNDELWIREACRGKFVVSDSRIRAIEVYDMAGNLVDERNVACGETLDLTFLPEGVYVVAANPDGGRMVKRIAIGK